MLTSHTETEIKLWASDLAAVAARLAALGAQLHVPRTAERNLRYDRADGSLSAQRQVLRLRQDAAARLTYKAPHSDDPRTRTELEVSVSDFETADQLLQALGFHVAWRYEKFRTTYWLGDCEIALDELPFGDFVEVEGKAIAAIEAVIAQLNMADAPRFTQSYSELFFSVRERLGLPFRDLTFENFRHLARADLAHALLTEADRTL
ncbi:MAG: CYTH domain-containing protein [Chloroflexi bacterium CFX4]|nr:CYTH domain-containing protein [Chloroflexi bacterium CFX4]MDL1923452.1 CYTH domain-containing protein [Chloroflexi bacterium CFX3]